MKENSSIASYLSLAIEDSFIFSSTDLETPQSMNSMSVRWTQIVGKIYGEVFLEDQSLQYKDLTFHFWCLPSSCVCYMTRLWEGTFFLRTIYIYIYFSNGFFVLSLLILHMRCGWNIFRNEWIVAFSSYRAFCKIVHLQHFNIYKHYQFQKFTTFQLPIKN